MQNKLQELTDKLYNEGLSKGKQEADKIVADASAQAEHIIDQANKKAAAIIAEAESRAEEMKVKVSSDLAMATRQTIASVKGQIETIVTAKAIRPQTETALADNSFLKELILKVVSSFNATSTDSVDLDIILPENAKASLEGKFADALRAELSKGSNIRWSDSIESGFRISPKDGGYFISFTGEDFEHLFAQYLRPATKKILFG